MTIAAIAAVFQIFGAVVIGDVREPADAVLGKPVQPAHHRIQSLPAGQQAPRNAIGVREDADRFMARGQQREHVFLGQSLPDRVANLGEVPEQR